MSVTSVVEPSTGSVASMTWVTPPVSLVESAIVVVVSSTVWVAVVSTAAVVSSTVWVPVVSTAAAVCSTGAGAGAGSTGAGACSTGAGAGAGSTGAGACSTGAGAGVASTVAEVSGTACVAVVSTAAVVSCTAVVTEPVSTAPVDTPGTWAEAAGARIARTTRIVSERVARSVLRERCDGQVGPTGRIRAHPKMVARPLVAGPFSMRVGLPRVCVRRSHDLAPSAPKTRNLRAFCELELPRSEFEVAWRFGAARGLHHSDRGPQCAPRAETDAPQMALPSTRPAPARLGLVS